MPSIQHNTIRDITAQLLTEVCPNVCVKPTLQLLTGERFPLRSTNTEEGTRLDIKAQNFWDKGKRSAFFDIRIFNSHALANCTSSTDACYRRHEQEKRRAYEQHVLQVEHGTLTPLQVKVGVRLPWLLSRDLQASFLRNMTSNHTAAPSASSDLRSLSA